MLVEAAILFCNCVIGLLRYASLHPEVGSGPTDRVVDDKQTKFHRVNEPSQLQLSIKLRICSYRL